MKRLRIIMETVLLAALLSVAGAFAFADEGGENASDGTQSGVSSVADPSTISNWQNIIRYDTSNVGRIWVDKSVSDSSLSPEADISEGKGNSAFITALSVLSSASNVSSTVTEPLDIVQGAGCPTKTTEGAEYETGYVTFDDQLGAYMQVDDLRSIVVGGQKYSAKEKSEEGNATTYRFTEQAKINNEYASLGNVVITVTKSSNAAVGDKLQVKVPAGMIPLRNFNVAEDEMVMSVTDADPLVVLYTSSLKSGVDDILARPDEAMVKYLDENSADGKVSFMANQWSGGELGNTVATFQPSSKNSYYYFTHDAPIYTDEACTQRVHEVKADETYWYKHDYYELMDKYSASGPAELRTESISFPGEAAVQFSGSIGTNDEGVFFKAGTARLTNIEDLHSVKTNNVTNTASDVLNPKWNDSSSTKAATAVFSYLGNNGKLLVDVPEPEPASVTIFGVKVLEAEEGLQPGDITGKFTFTVTSEDEHAPMPERSTATNDENGNVDFGSISFRLEDLNAVLEANGSDEPVVSGSVVDQAAANEVPDVAGREGSAAGNEEPVVGAGQPRSYTFTYNVTESGSAPGIANDPAATKTVQIKVTDDGQGNLTAVRVGEASQPAFSFTNTYHAASVSVALGAFKQLEGKTLEEGQFSFLLKAEGETVSEAKNAADGTIAFPEVTFGRPGTYNFAITEVNDGQSNVAYDASEHLVSVAVTDNGQGQLVAQVEGVQDAVFKNVYIEPSAPKAPSMSDSGDQPSNPGSTQGGTDAVSDGVATGDSALAAIFVTVAALLGVMVLAVGIRRLLMK